MTPIVGGLVSALIITVSALCSARASRLAGAIPTVAGAMLVGLVVTMPLVLLDPPTAFPSPTMLGWAALSGFGNVLGLWLAYRAYRYGAVGVVATICSTEGAIAAVLSLIAGEVLAAGTVPVLGLISLGVGLAASGGGQELEEGQRIDRDRSLRAALLAAGGAVCFGASLFATGELGAGVPMAVAILPARVVGTVALAIPLLVTRRLSIPSQALPFVVLTGLAEVGGLAAFLVGAREEIAVTAVLASLFAPFAALAAFLLFRERLAVRQLAGIAVVTVGVGTLGILHA